MKVADVLVDLVEWSVAAIPVADQRRSIGGTVRCGVVRVRTDDGLEGNAIIGPLDLELAPCLVQLVDVLLPRLIGLSLASRAWLWDQLEEWAGHGFPLHPALAPIDIALWDIEGKAAGAPVHELLGAASTSMPAVATSPPLTSDPEAVAAQVAAAVADGFLAYKIHPGAMPIDDVVKTAELAREAAGPSVALMVDPNNGYDLHTALEVGRALDDNGFDWYEDPVIADDWESVVQLSNRLRTPLAVGDAIGYLLRHAQHAVAIGAPAIIRGNARKLGITGLMRLCGLVERHGLRCEVGFGGNASMNAANLHVALATDGCSFYEHFLPAGYHEVGVLEPVKVTHGFAHAPSAPGLGLELDEEMIAAHTLKTLR